MIEHSPPAGGRSLPDKKIIDPDIQKVRDAGGPAIFDGQILNRIGWKQSLTILPLQDALDCFAKAKGERINVDQNAAIQCWPWMIQAVVRYRSVEHRMAEYPSRTPAQVKVLMAGIGRDALSLAENLSELANRLDISTPGGDEFGLSAMIDIIGRGLIGINHPDHTANRLNITKHWELIGLATNLQLVGELAQAFSTANVSAKGRGAASPGLDEFISYMACVWKRVTGRKASASASVSVASQEPPFVRFSRLVSKYAGVRQPTLAMIRQALKS